MLTPPAKIPYKHSIVVKLLRRAFSYYLLIAFVVTVIQLINEYYHVKEQIIGEIHTLEASFEPILADSLWLFDERQIRLTLKSMVKSPVIMGVKIIDKETLNLIAFGSVLEDETVLIVDEEGNMRPRKLQESVINALFDVSFTIQSNENNEPLGAMSIYSGTSIIIDRIKHSFTVILINAIIKTTALWIIFLWVGRTLVRYPLNVLNQTAEQINSGDEEVMKVKEPETEKLQETRDEIGVLARNLEKMRNVFLEKMETIEKQNSVLEEQAQMIEERVRKGHSQIDKKTRHIGDVVQGMSQMMYNITDHPPQSGDAKKNLFITIEENKRPFSVPVEKVSHITVEEHYFTVFYHHQNRWKQWNTFGNLKEFDENFPGVFTRINRSTLINPKRILEFQIEKTPYHLIMEGDPAHAIPVSQSKKKLLLEIHAKHPAGKG